MRENFCELVEKKIFVQKNLADCLLVPLKDATPPYFAEKTFANSHKTSKFAKVFFLKSFKLYGISLPLSNFHTNITYIAMPICV